MPGAQSCKCSCEVTFSQPKHSFVIMVVTPFWNSGTSGTPEAIWSTPQRRRQRAQFAGSDIIERRCRGAKVKLDLSAQQIGHHRRCAAIRHMHYIGAGHHLEQLAVDMRRAAAA